MAITECTVYNNDMTYPNPENKKCLIHRLFGEF